MNGYSPSLTQKLQTQRPVSFVSLKASAPPGLPILECSKSHDSSCRVTRESAPSQTSSPWPPLVLTSTSFPCVFVMIDCRSDQQFSSLCHTLCRDFGFSSPIKRQRAFSCLFDLSCPLWIALATTTRCAKNLRLGFQRPCEFLLL